MFHGMAGLPLWGFDRVCLCGRLYATTLVKGVSRFIPIYALIMKRSRPGVVLTALGEPARVPELARTLLEPSATSGVRWTHYQCRLLPREMVSLATPHETISFKVSRLDGRVVTVTPELEEVRRLAREKGLPVREVLDSARAEGRRLLAPRGRSRG
jgi:pyridinium-3,5-bisthiocarboxylic acid mononucleotide nickel chelatase